MTLSNSLTDALSPKLRVSNHTSPEFKLALVATRLWTLVQIRDAEFGKRALVSTSQLNASLLSCIVFGVSEDSSWHLK